jgi:hypothetical protein
VKAGQGFGGPGSAIGWRRDATGWLAVAADNCGSGAGEPDDIRRGRRKLQVTLGTEPMPMRLSRALGTSVVRVLIDAAFATPWTRRGIFRYWHCLVPLTTRILGDAPTLAPSRSLHRSGEDRSGAARAREWDSSR